MSYNSKQYNTRNSGRYNTPGQFVAAAEQQQQQQQQIPSLSQSPYTANTMPRKPPPPPPQKNANLQSIQTMDVDVKSALDTSLTGSNSGDSTPRPHWMKSKFGVKKVKNKERRRRQNEHLRRLLTPKNALMVLNELLPNEQVNNQFKVENTTPYYNKRAQQGFCVDLTINGNTYKGYGDTKMTARNVAAEQAIRDLIIQKFNKSLLGEGSAMEGEGENASAAGGSGGEGAEGGAGAGDEEALPMLQLASFALHKLFAEWEYEGHKVPQLKPSNSNSMSESDGLSANPPPPPAPPKKKVLPANAAAMHPCMLLTYMRPSLAYRELAVDGDRPQNMIFTLGVDVDGSTYIGKAPNKKEARKLAARAACTALFGVHFTEDAADNAPQATTA